MITQILDYLKNLPVYFYTSLGIMALIAILSVIAGNKVKKMDVRQTPSKFMTIFISAVESYNTMIKGYIGKHWTFVAPVTLTLAAYVFLSNISGAFALDSPTKYTSITFSISITSFIIVQLTGLISQSWRHFLGLFKPFWPMFPLNVMSEFTPIISMSLRLFGNIASGSVFLFLIYKFGGWLSIFIAPAFHMVFDIGFGLIQAVVVVLLTVIFASNKVSESDFAK
ncbi:MAG: F0F1 ATP synthase subunit A [Acholeplasmataceae bacterium]|nr:F0F1 ATP synthase subunit A [Acholeplasmataceae bacterium]